MTPTLAAEHAIVLSSLSSFFHPLVVKRDCKWQVGEEGVVHPNSTAAGGAAHLKPIPDKTLLHKYSAATHVCC